MNSVRKNYGNNGIYGRVSNVFGTSCLDPIAFFLRSGKITRGYLARFVALAPPKFPFGELQIAAGTLCEIATYF